MNNQDFTTTILVDQTPQEAFEAINNVRGWWSENVTGSTEKINDEFTYKAKELHRCTMKLTEVVPGKKVVWLVLNNYFSFVNDQSEWKDTKIIFEISKQGDKTEIRFMHQGLVPEYECFDICQNAWTDYINNSLHDLIATGKGQPNRKEEQLA